MCVLCMCKYHELAGCVLTCLLTEWRDYYLCGVGGRPVNAVGSHRHSKQAAPRCDLDDSNRLTRRTFCLLGWTVDDSMEKADDRVHPLGGEERPRDIARPHMSEHAHQWVPEFKADRTKDFALVEDAAAREALSVVHTQASGVRLSDELGTCHLHQRFDWQACERRRLPLGASPRERAGASLSRTCNTGCTLRVRIQWVESSQPGQSRRVGEDIRRQHGTRDNVAPRGEGRQTWMRTRG